MKVEAVRIGNSKKEQILVNGHVFLKSVDIGRWNYIVLEYAQDSWQEVRDLIFDDAYNPKQHGPIAIGKSATLKAAQSLKLIDCATYLDIEYNGRPASFATTERIEAFKSKHPNWVKRKTRCQGFNVVRLVAPQEVKHLIFKIEREDF